MNGKKKLLASAALTASLAAGGAVGAMFGTPTVSLAQTEPTKDVQAAPNSAPGETQGDVERAPAPAVAGSERNAETGHEGRRGRPGHHAHRRVGLEAAAEALGMTPEELKTELRNGKSVAEVAEARNVELATVVDAIVDAVTEQAEERANQFVHRKRPAAA